VQPLPFDDDSDAAESEAVVCGSKSACEEMVDCAEAQRFLKQCGVPRDGDGAGVACDSRCQ
jgi:micrococcal nuclease